MNERAAGVVFLFAALIAKIAVLWLTTLTYSSDVKALNTWIESFLGLGIGYLVWAEGPRLWRFLATHLPSGTANTTP